MPFISAAIGAIGAAIGLGSVGVGLAQAAVAIGLNFVVGKIQQNQAKKSQKTVSGTQFDREYGENVSRKVACGLVGLAGHDIYVNTYASANKQLHQIYVLSDYPCDGLSRVWAGGKELQLTEVSPNNWAVGGDYNGLMSISFFDGTQTGAVSILVETANPLGRWTNDHVGHGMCFIIVSMQYNQERLSQFPEFFFEIRGARLYDPRKDSSIGGSGGHRWGDYTTHEFSQNPVIMNYNYRRGFSWNGDLFLGMDMDTSDLPIDKYAVAANICDEIEEGEARYRCSIMLDADAAHGDNIDALMTSCGGMVIDSVDGSWPLIGTEQPIVATFTDDDMIVSEPVRFQRRRSMAELVNSVGGTYPEPSNMWSPAGYDTQTNASQVALDRRTRDLQINFETVPSKRQANQLASIYYNENRYEATADVVLRPYFQDIRVGDWVRWISARYGDRVYIVQSRSIRALTSDGPRNVALSLQERDGEIYAGAGTIAPTIPFPNGEPVYLNELQDWAVIPVLSVAQDGRPYPAFRMSWSNIDDVTVQGIQFRWWPENEPDNIFYKSTPADVTLAFIQEGVVGQRRYVFQHQLIAPTRVTTWSQTITVASLDGGNGDLEVYLDNLNKEVLDVFEQQFKAFDDMRPLIERMLTDQQLLSAATEVSRRTFYKEVDNSRAEFNESIRTVSNDLGAAVTQLIELEAEFVGNSAEVTQQLTALVDSDQAISTTVTNLAADYASNKSSVQQELTSLSSETDALALMAQTLTASVNDVSAQGLVKFALASNQAGVDARFSVLIRGSVGELYKETGFFLEIVTTNGVQYSRFSVLADRFVVTNGVSGTLPMVFENGALKLQIANIGTITAALLYGAGGKAVFDLNAPYLSFSD